MVLIILREFLNISLAGYILISSKQEKSIICYNSSSNYKYHN